MDEVDQRRGDAVATVSVERLGRELSGDALRQDAFAARAEVPADDDCIRAGAPQAVVERLQHAVGIPAGLVLRGSGQDRDVHGPGARRVDRAADAVLLGAADRKLRVRVDVDGVGLQSRDGGVDPLARARLRAQCQCQCRRDGHGQHDESFHRARARRARLRAS